MNNCELVSELKEAVLRERACAVEVLRYLREVEIRFTVTREEMAMIQKLMDRKSHSNFERKYEALFVALAKVELQKLEGNQTKDTAQLSPDKIKPRTRHIPKQIQRKIWQRDHGQCQYTDPLTRRSWQATHGLQLDHRQPHAEGGLHTEENLRLLCGAHSRFRNSG